MASISGSSSSLLDQISSIPQEKRADTEIKAPSGKGSFVEGTSSIWGKFKAFWFPNQVRAARTAAFDQIKNEISEKYKASPDFKANVLKSFDNSFRKGEAVLANAVINFVEMQDAEFAEAKARSAAPVATAVSDATGTVAKTAAKVAKGTGTLGSALYSMVSTSEDKKKLAAAQAAQTDAVRVDLNPDNFKQMSLSDTKKALGEIQKTLHDVYESHEGKSEAEIKSAFEEKAQGLSLFAQAMVRQTFKADSKNNWITKALGNIKDKKEGQLELNIDNGAICGSSTGEAMFKALHVSDNDVDAMKQASADARAQRRAASQQTQQNIGRKWGVR